MALISNGFSLKDINNLSIQEAQDLWVGLQNGLWGFTKDYMLAYNQNYFLHLLKETLIGVNSNKPYRAKPFVKFDKLYPQVDFFLNGKDPKDTDVNEKFKLCFRMHGSKV